MNRFLSLLNYSVRVGKIAGVPISLHITLLFFLLPVMSNRGASGIWYASAFVVGVVTSILLHELGHALTAKHLGMTGLSIMLHGFGGFASSRGYRTPREALLITLAGPAVTFALGLILWGIGALGLRNDLDRTAYIVFFLIRSLGLFNILLGFLNLLPSFPFDGGHALQAIQQRKHTEFVAMRFVAHVGFVASCILFAAGLIFDQRLWPMFGLIGGITSFMMLKQTGGVRFREFKEEQRRRKEEVAFRLRQKEKNESYLDEVQRRSRKRDEDERLKKLFGSED